jgi:carbon storage regulator
MLVLARKSGEDIIATIPPSSVARQVRIIMVETRGDKARIGVEADKDIVVHRGEIQRVIDSKDQ